MDQSAWAETFSACKGKTIAHVALADDELRMLFTDGTGIRLWDDAQSCCESRYMRTDDTLSDFHGAKLIGGEIRDTGEYSGEDENTGDCHDIQFLVIETDRGALTVSSHNEHNGFYGGFSVQCRALEAP
jgi:hypothetical protein